MGKKSLGLSLNAYKPQEDASAVKSNSATETEQKIAAINTTSSTTADPFGYKLVPYTKIKRNPKNDYEIVDIDSLKESMLRGELLHNMVATYDLDSDIYTIISGERRFTAMLALHTEFENGAMDESKLEFYKTNIAPYFEKGFPCKILNRTIKLDEIDELILLNEANMEVRELSPAKKAEKVALLQELYRKRNERDGITSSVQAKVAETLKISERQVRQYTAVNEKLIPELKEEFDRGDITLKNGSAFAQLDEEGQRSILELIKKNGKVDAGDLAALKEEKAQREQRIKELENELLAKDDELRKSEENIEQAIKKNNDLVLSLNRTKENFAQKEETLRQQLQEELEQNNETAMQELRDELEKIERDKQTLSENIESIQQENRDKEEALNVLRKELEEAKQETKQKTQNHNVSDNEKLMFKYSYELSKSVEEIKSLIKKSQRVIIRAEELNLPLSEELKKDIDYIKSLQIKSL